MENSLNHFRQFPHREFIENGARQRSDTDLFGCPIDIERDELQKLKLRLTVAVRLPAPRMGVHNPSLSILVDVGEEVG